MKISLTLALFSVGFAQFAHASDFPRVDTDIKTYDDQVVAMNASFNELPVNSNDKVWVEAKIQHMFDVDQYMRKYSDMPFNHSYSDAEKKEFENQFMPRWYAVDAADLADLKGLLKIYTWFTISEFGKVTDQNAWLLVQHADLDPAFQQTVLSILDGLWQKGETSPANYAYLFDRVAASYNDLTHRKLQRYGTQGKCTGPETWQPIPMEDPDHIDDRRATVGLGSEADYMKLFKDICH